MADGREWKFQKDVSIAGPDSQKCEMVTPILTYADMETLQELVRILRKAGAKSDATRMCGVHVHIGAKGHTPQTLRNLANIMASHESLIAEALDLDHGRMNRYCKTVDPKFLEVLNKKKPDTMAKFADIWYHPEYFRMAVFESALDPDVKKRALAGEVDIKFNCKPQLFLKSGEIEQTVMDGGYIYNPTPYTAAPTLRFKFPDSEEGGSITINGVTISIQKPGSGEDFIIDCERQDIYLRGGRVNKNNDFVLSNGEFFELRPGRNKVQCTGLYLNRVWITPNWWTV